MKYAVEHEKREYERIPAVGSIRIDGEEFVSHGYVVNISEGGLMAKVHDLPRPNTRVSLMFHLPPNSHLFKLEADIVWGSSSNDMDFSKVMGVKFVNLSEKDRSQIREYMDNQG